MPTADDQIERLATAMGEADRWSLCDNSPDYRAHLPAWKDYEHMARAALEAVAPLLASAESEQGVKAQALAEAADCAAQWRRPSVIKLAAGEMTAGLSAADEAQMALCQLSWIEEGNRVHPHRIECIRKALERLSRTRQPIEPKPSQAGEPEQDAGRELAWFGYWKHEFAERPKDRDIFLAGWDARSRVSQPSQAGEPEQNAGLVERLLKRAAEDQSCADNGQVIVDALAEQMRLFEAREGHNVYAVRMAVDHKSSVKRDQKYADDLRAAAEFIRSRQLAPDADARREALEAAVAALERSVPPQSHCEQHERAIDGLREALAQPGAGR